MHCSACTNEIDEGARFCEHCGTAVAAVPVWRRGLFWLYAVLVLVVMAAAAGYGYYRFILPNGAAAEVNGEVITVAEVDALLRTNSGAGGVPAAMQGRMRYAALSELITERIALQEARTAGVTVSSEEVQTAMDSMRAASGLDEKAFAARVNERYGSMKAFRKGVEKRLLVRKFVDERVTAGALSAADANERMSRWLQGATAKAAVRVALDEQLPSAGCGCCSGGKGRPGQDAAGRGCGAGKGCDPKKGPAAGQGDVKAAQEAALAYWQQRNGGGPVETKVTDFGCHVQVDIIANNKIAQSLRYQNGTISEM